MGNIRKVMTFNEFFDVMDQIGDTKYVNIGYVTGANLDVPQVKRRNPATNRMKGYDDYSHWGEDVAALVKIITYNFQYRTREKFNQSYVKYKDDFNNIRVKYGLEPIKRKENGYTQKQEYGKNGIDFYKGDDESKQGRTYIQQNLYNVKPKDKTYAINSNGDIIRELDRESEVLPFVKKSKGIDGVAALRKMNVDEETINRYIEEVSQLKMKVRTFEASSILFAVATVNGEKIIYINNRLSRAVNDINIRPETFVAIVKERYKEAIEESKRYERSKRTIKLTESDIRKIVKESVLRLTEGLNNQNYSHFAVNKVTNKIVNGWDYHDEDPYDLRTFKREYFIDDLIDYELDPKDYKILNAKTLLRMGIDPDDDSNWANR